MQSSYSSLNMLLHVSWQITGNTAGLPQMQGQILPEPSVTSQGKNLRYFVSAESKAELYKGLKDYPKWFMYLLPHSIKILLSQ